MKLAAFFVLATAVPAFGAYSYYYPTNGLPDNLTSNSGYWTANGTTSFTSSGFTSSGSSIVSLHLSMLSTTRDGGKA